MAEIPKIKITVLRRFSPKEVFAKNPVTPVRPMVACERLKDGQEFFIGQDRAMPEGFCPSAWQSIYANVRTLQFGGNMPFYKEKGIAISCCTDGLRPVVFEIKRV